jgi:biopolymer transport protein TolR
MGFSLNQNSGRRRGRKQVMSEINVTPFVDVMLVLLIIFMVTSPMLVAGINVDLPETTASPVTGQDEPLSVSVDSQGNVYIQDVMVEEKELTDKLKAITKEKMDTRIFVHGDKSVDYGKVIEVVGLINVAGFNKVALVTDIKAEGSR